MIKFGDNIYIGVSNNWRKLHGFPLTHTKRYPHERRWLTKRARIRYHAMLKAGCDTELIYRSFRQDYEDEIARRIAKYATEP